MDTVKTKHIKYVQKCFKNKLIQGQMFIIFSSGIREGLSRKDELSTTLLSISLLGESAIFLDRWLHLRAHILHRTEMIGFMQLFMVHNKPTLNHKRNLRQVQRGDACSYHL